MNTIETPIENSLTLATKAARERTGKLIATTVKCGLWQVQEITYQKKPRKTIVTPLSDWIPGSQVIAFLGALEASC